MDSSLTQETQNSFNDFESADGDGDGNTIASLDDNGVKEDFMGVENEYNTESRKKKNSTSSMPHTLIVSQSSTVFWELQLKHTGPLVDQFP